MNLSARSAILGLFFLSGACTLVYEVVWARMLIPVFGVSIYAISTVLTAFMAGLAIGSFYFGRLADRRDNGLRIYAVLELGIGAFALLFPLILSGLEEIYTPLYRLLGDVPTAFLMARFLLTFAVLLVPTILMGATLPVLCKYAVREIDSAGWAVGRLYAVNTFGGAVGAFIAAFLLIEALGVSGTIWVAALLNLVIAAAAWGLSKQSEEADRGVETADTASPVTPTPGSAGGGTETDARVLYLILGAFALSGFAALGYEVIWARLLTSVLRSVSAQALSTILVSFLIGLAAGGAVGAKLADRQRDGLGTFAVIELLIGLFGLVSVYAVSAIPLLFQIASSQGSYAAYIIRLFAAAFIVMLIPTFLMGLLFPLVGKLAITGLRDLGRRVGTVYGINTVGTIFGAFASGFILIPLLGTERSVDLLAWLNIAIGYALLVASRVYSRQRKLIIGGCFSVVFALLTLLLPNDTIRSLIGFAEPLGNVIHFEETVGGTVSVHVYGGGVRILKVNGGAEVPTTFHSLQTFRLLGSLPLVLHPKAEEVLVVAFGGGITLAAAEAQGPKRIDCVEVVEGVPDAAHHFAEYNNRIFERFDSNHIEIIVDDGRNHILRTDRRYDVILSDATHPGTADSWILYTEEFYRQSQDRLRAGGIIAQWLPLHGLSPDDFKMVLRTFQTVFPHATLWVTDIYAVMLGTPEELKINYRQLQARLRRRAAQPLLREAALDDAVGFLGTMALDEQGLREFVGQGPTNTDDRPYISFTDRKRAGSASGAPALLSLMPFVVETMSPFVSNVSAHSEERLQKRLRARRHTLRGTAHFLEREYVSAKEEFDKAVSIDPMEENARRYLSRYP